MARALGRRAGAYAPALLVSSAVGSVCIRAILARAGEPALPLDDAFIHMQYARRLAEGGFYSFVEGEGYSSGATSMLWPALLAPFHAIGVRGLSLVWAVWALGTLFHAAVVLETFRLSQKLVAPAAALGAGAMSAFFGAFAWFAWSGMETVALAWVLLRTARAGAEHCESEAAVPNRALRIELAALGVLAPLVRPEGLLASLVAAAALAIGPRGELEGRARWLALAPLAGPAIQPLTSLALAGHLQSSTAMVKWFVSDPYLDRAGLRAAIEANVRLLFAELLDGRGAAGLFLPEGAALPIVAGLFSLVVVGVRRRAPMRAGFTLVVALGMLIPCTYSVLLWNRIRYLWPFAGAWFVGLACLASLLAGLLGRLVPRFRIASLILPGVLTGAVAGALATKLPITVRDLATSARAIALQQVTLGRWAKKNLPADSRIGLNDTGALAYFGDRATFDIVGLTTEGEGRYWAAGAGSRFEHYEKLDRARLPTHFIVYPHWMACPAVLGDALTEARVDDQSILGGDTMVAYEARWDMLGTGDRPRLAEARGRIVDEIDVADLESEKEHHYELLPARAADDRAVVLEPPSPGGARIAEGGRYRRRLDRFVARGAAGRSGRLVMRLSSDKSVELMVRVGERELGVVKLPGGTWVERAIEIPLDAMADAMHIEVASMGRRRRQTEFASFHYWLFAD